MVETITYRPNKSEAETIIKSLKRLAKKDKRSLNGYIHLVITEHLKTKENELGAVK